MKILIFGLPGSGKTYLANELMNLLGTDQAEWYNADAIRQECGDWDFSNNGRARQLQRMRILAQQSVDKGKIAICDFICPTEAARELFAADYNIFVDTIEESKYEDTNKLFERPTTYDYRVLEKSGTDDAERIADLLKAQ